MPKSMPNTVAQSLLRQIFFSRPHVRLIMLLTAIFGAVFGLLGPFFQKQFVDELTGGSSSQFFANLPSLNGPLGSLSLSFTSVLLGLACNQLVVYLGATEAILIQRKWGQDLYEKILSLKMDSLAKHQLGEIVAIYTTDLPGATILLEQSLPQILNIIFPIIFAPLLIVSLFDIPLFNTVLLMAAVVGLNLYMASRQSTYFYKFKRLAAQRVGLVNEWVQNIRTIRILGWTEAVESKIFKMREVETQNRVSMLNNGQTMNALAASITFLINVSLIMAMVTKSGGTVTPGSLLALLWIAAIFLTRPFRQMPWFFTFLFDGTSSLLRTANLFSLVNSDSAQRSPLESARPTAKVDLEVNNLSLEIAGKKILDDLSFNINEGEFVAIVGAVGSGKSMLLLSLLGETSAHFGAYKIAGLDASLIPLQQLRSFFTFVPQEGFIMSASLRENIAFEYNYSNAQDTKILKSLLDAQFTLNQERVNHGLDTEIGERGVNLSGGQKQRVSLARVDYLSAPIFLLDDCLSAVDVDTEKKILSELINGQWKNRTRILATHRLSVLETADRVFFLKSGKLVASGSFKMLMTSNPDFREYTSSLRETP